MKMALVQQHATPDKAANIARGLAAVDRAAASGAKVIGFAELAFEMFHPQYPANSTIRSLSETLDGPLVKAFQAKAEQHGVVLVLNFFERDGLETYDCSPVIDANGVVLGMTRMVHITEYACFHEQGYYTPGDTGAPVYDTRYGKIGVAICYDRHFPEYMRALALSGADLVMVPQAGVVGEWTDGLYESFVCGPFGEMIAQAPRGHDCVLLADIDLAANNAAPARTQFLRHRRPELYADWVARA
jgi:N-carbamoylputrescine amidase